MQDSLTTSATGASRKPPSAPNSARRTVYRILETAQDDDLGSKIVDIVLIAFILASVLAVVMESIPAFETRYATQFWLFEVVTVAVFSVEYLLRVWSAVEETEGHLKRPFMARLRYVFSFYALIDLLAILPFFLLTMGLLSGFDMRFLRAIRLLRVLKLTRYSSALNMLFATFKENSQQLGAAFLILMTIMLLAASGMYYFERQSQPEDFGSIPAAMWWAFATLTTVGYGDVTPITVGGKIFGALIAVVGIGMVALPTSILASGYTRQLRSSATVFKKEAKVALDDGVISDEERKSLEMLRIDLGLSKHTASQILDAGQVRHALRQSRKSNCPHCHQVLPTAQ